MKTPRLYDISLTIEPGMLTWLGDPPFSIEAVESISQGDSANVSLLKLSSHAGTHVDAPRHFIQDADGVDCIPPDVLIGKARLFQLGNIRSIDRDLLRSLKLEGTERLLLGTGNSNLLRQRQFAPDYAFLTEDGAHYLVEIGVKLVGIDYLSIEGYGQEGYPVHRILLGAGIIIIEGVDLTGIPTGEYELICAPLKIKDADGAPARVFLREL